MVCSNFKLLISNSCRRSVFLAFCLCLLPPSASAPQPQLAIFCLFHTPVVQLLSLYLFIWCFTSLFSFFFSSFDSLVFPRYFLLVFASRLFLLSLFCVSLNSLLVLFFSTCLLAPNVVPNLINFSISNDTQSLNVHKGKLLKPLPRNHGG